MKVLMIGQCQGGNAFLWKDFIENNLVDYPDIEFLHYVCKNSSAGEFNISSDCASLKKLYGNKWSFDFFEKIKTKVVSDYIAIPKIKTLYDKHQYDIIHIQGLYELMYVEEILKVVGGKTVIHIYGSDFYQKYLNGSRDYKNHFEKVIDSADQVLFNFKQSQKDFLDHIPIESKATLGCMGVSGWWSGYNFDNNKKDNVTRLLSTRGLYSYNNVENLVDAFIDIYGGNSSYELWIVNGYGWHEETKDRVKSKIKEQSNIKDLIGEWISEERLREIYDKCDYNFCIGDTDQLTVSILYGYLRGCVNIISKLESYKELDDAGFKTHFYVDDINKLSIILKNLPSINGFDLKKSKEIAENKFLFSSRFKNTYEMYKSLASK